MRRMSERELLYVVVRERWHLMPIYRQYIQIFIIPIAFTFAGFIGIAVTSAGISLYGEVLWDPLRWVRACV
jgi:hypothetical protein